MLQTNGTYSDKPHYEPCRQQQHTLPLQHGFRSKRSCETQLVEFVEDITCNMAAGKQTDILIMDFSKVFDKVCHSLLVHIWSPTGECPRAGSIPPLHQRHARGNKVDSEAIC